MRLLIAIPALNEELVIRRNVAAVADFAKRRLSEIETSIVVVDNGSTDKTAAVVESLMTTQPTVHLIRLVQAGKGRAIRAAWESMDADVYVFMDADLATDIEALPKLIAEAVAGDGLAVGNRWHAESRVERSPWRRLLSWGFRTCARLILNNRTEDLPCGFKAATARAVRAILPQVHNQQWFFDTELVVRTENAGFAVREVPVQWREQVETGRQTRVRVGKLIREYLQQAWALRLELRRASLTEDDRTERRWRWRFVVIALVVTALPPLFGWWQAARHGASWMGLYFLAPDDFAYYLSMMNQGRQGRWLIENMFTTAIMPAQLNVFWALLGHVAGWLHLSSIMVWQAARLALIPVLAIVASNFFRQVLPRVNERILALGLLFFAGGLGPYFVALRPFSMSADHQWPIDLWVTESNGFLTLFYSPHFLAALILMILCFSLFLRAAREGGRSVAFGAAVAASGLTLIAPFSVPVLVAVPAIWLLWEHYAGRAVWRNGLFAWAMLVAASAPWLAYYYFWSRLDANTAAFTTNNACPTPAIWFVLIGFGVPAIAALLGLKVLRREQGDVAAYSFVSVWLMVQLILIYIPVVFSRRMILGMEVPILVLAAPTLVWWWSLLRRGLSFSVARLIVAVFVLMFIVPASLLSLSRAIYSFAMNQPAMFWLSSNERQTLTWLAENSPENSAIIAIGRPMTLVPAYANRHSYAGHWVAAIDIQRKEIEIRQFFLQMTDPQRADFMRATGLTHVWCGPVERSVGGCPTSAPLFESVWSSGDIEIFFLRQK